jgi:hypothetical protein
MRYPFSGILKVLRRQRMERVGQDCRDGADHEYLRALLPPGLTAALPTLPVAVLFVAVALARRGRRPNDLARQFRLSSQDARTIAVYALSIRSKSSTALPRAPQSDRYHEVGV